MEMFHLRYFVAVAENLSFSQAARSLHMATSPLSQRVRDLERDLGTTLFDRDSHRVNLTRDGAALLPIAKDALGRFDDIPWRLKQATGTERRTVYAGVAPGTHPRMREKLTALDERCAQDYVIKRWPGGSSDLLAAVQRGELALALVHLPVHAAGISARRVFQERLGAVLPAEEFGAQESVSLSDLLDHTYVSSAPGMLPTYFEQLAVRFAAAGINKRIVLDTADYGSIREVVANGSSFAVTILDPGSSMRQNFGEKSIVLPFNDFSPTLSTGLIWRDDRADERGDLHGLIEQAQASF